MVTNAIRLGRGDMITIFADCLRYAKNSSIKLYRTLSHGAIIEVFENLVGPLELGTVLQTILRPFFALSFCSTLTTFGMLFNNN
jgi:hypothetical protein